MEKVTWFYEDDNGNMVNHVSMGILEKEKAVELLNCICPKGKYILGYFKTDGTKRLFKSTRKIV